MLLKRFWRDQRGFVATTDLILIFSIAVLGTIVGLATLRNSVVQEFGDLATAIGSLNQSYEFDESEYEADPGDPNSFRAWVAGSDYTDNPDFCDGPDTADEPPAGINVTVTASSEGS
ncbi:MAG: hypothetical protein RBS80_17090 [Thermoguttaceae bacterium]|jgi:Flp pilus assembly pilin Flp|nr:hypothetical protein [Thermoguttaceae bacterium]